jgi:hypothetical protein
LVEEAGEKSAKQAQAFSQMDRSPAGGREGPERYREYVRAGLLMA